MARRKILKGVALCRLGTSAYIIAGTAQNQCLWLVKLDSLGETLWARTYKPDSCFCCVGRSVIELAGRGYIVAGNINFDPPGGGDFIYILRTDTLGDSLWARKYHPQWGAGCWNMAKARDGGFVIAGWVRTDSFAYMDAFLLRADSFGDTLWTRAYGNPESQEASSVLPLDDGGFVITGGSINSAWDAYAVRTDSVGTMLWSHTYGGGGSCDDEFAGALAPPDGGFLFSGYTCSRGSGGSDAWLVRTNDEGETLWTRTYGGTGDDCCCAMLNPDGGYTCYGQTFSYGAGGSDVWLFQTNKNGVLQWSRTFGGLRWDYPESAQPTDDGGFILAGMSESFGIGWNELYAIKTDAEGSAAIVENREDRRPEKPIPLIQVPGLVAGQLTCQYFQPIAGTARVELFDASGRRLNSADLGYHVSGWHDLQVPVAPPAGARFLRLFVRGQSATAKFIVP